MFCGSQTEWFYTEEKQKYGKGFVSLVLASIVFIRSFPDQMIQLVQNHFLRLNLPTAPPDSIPPLQYHLSPTQPPIWGGTPSKAAVHVARSQIAAAWRETTAKGRRLRWNRTFSHIKIKLCLSVSDGHKNTFPLFSFLLSRWNPISQSHAMDNAASNYSSEHTHPNNLTWNTPQLSRAKITPK